MPPPDAIATAEPATFAVTFRSDAVRDAYVTAAHTFVEVVRSVASAVGTAGWDAPGLGEWSLRSLVGHTGRALATVPAYLVAGVGQPVTLTHAFEYFAVLSTAAADPAAVAERGRQAGVELGGDPLARVEALADDALGALASAADDAPVASPAGVMRLADYLVSRIVELTIHTGDVARAAGIDFAPAPGPATITFASIGAIATAQGSAGDAIATLAGRVPLPEGYSTF